MGSRVFNKITLVTSMALSMYLLANAVHAKGDEFKYELSGQYSHSEDELDFYNFDQALVNISIFEREVGYGEYPFVLTNFFERRTHLDFSYYYVEAESQIDESSADFLKINYSFASVSSPVLFNLGASRLVGDGTDTLGKYDIDAITLYFGFGYYLSPNSVANLSVTAADYRISDDVNPDIDYDDTHVEATWQHVRKIGEKNYIALLLDVEAIEIGSSKNSNVGGFFDYYPNRETGFGIGYTAHRGDYGVTEGATLTLRASMFLDTRIGVEAEVGRLFADAADSDEDSYSIKGIYRF